MINVKLIGPISLSRHNNIPLNRQVVIFGERHEYGHECPTTDTKEIQVSLYKYLRNIISNSPYVIDVFIEIPWESKIKMPDVMMEQFNTSNRYLNQVYHALSDCKYKNKEIEMKDPNDDSDIYDSNNISSCNNLR